MWQEFLRAIFAFFSDGLLLFITFISAEGLTRLAFPEQVQFWKLGQRGTFGSKEIASQTLGGYLLVGIFLGYDVIFYFLATKYFHWWTPSDILAEPNILASYFPWLGPFVQALHAGVWEECMFRAIPLAGAALLGQRWGHRRLFIAAALIIQALIFGAGHATYPNMPAYARLVELIVPSLAFAWLYLSWGLLPGIILHFIFDVVQMAIPLFVSTAAGMWFSRITIIVLSLLPIGAILYWRYKNKKFSELSLDYLNSGWAARTEDTPTTSDSFLAKANGEMPLVIKRLVITCGVLGLAAFIGAMIKFRPDAPQLTVTRQQAEHIAKEELRRRSIVLGPEWRMLCSQGGFAGTDDEFIWRTAGKKIYSTLLGTYLEPPHWSVRYVKFSGEVSARAEEYHLYIDHQSEVYRFNHDLPEAQAGERLEQKQAQAIAQATIAEKFQIKAEQLQEISASPHKLPARTDWSFSYADNSRPPLPQGQARLSVSLSGNMVSDYSRYIHIPEEWSRAEQSRVERVEIIGSLCRLFTVLLSLTAFICAIRGWRKKQFSVRGFIEAGALVLGTQLIAFFLGWPEHLASFNTTMSFQMQVLMLAAFSGMGMLMMSLTMGLMYGFAQNRLRRPTTVQLAFPWTGLAWAAVLAVLLSCFHYFINVKQGPTWPDYDDAGNYLPVLSAALRSLSEYVSSAISWTLLVVALEWLSNGWQRRRILSAALIILLGLLFAGSGQVSSITQWLVAGVGLGGFILLSYLLIVRYAPANIIIIIAGLNILSAIEKIFINAYPGAVPGEVLGIVLIALVAKYGFKRLHREEKI